MPAYSRTFVILAALVCSAITSQSFGCNFDPKNPDKYNRSSAEQKQYYSLTPQAFTVCHEWLNDRSLTAKSILAEGDLTLECPTYMDTVGGKQLQHLTLTLSMPMISWEAYQKGIRKRLYSKIKADLLHGAAWGLFMAFTADWYDTGSSYDGLGAKLRLYTAATSIGAAGMALGAYMFCGPRDYPHLTTKEIFPVKYSHNEAQSPQTYVTLNLNALRDHLSQELPHINCLEKYPGYDSRSKVAFKLMSLPYEARMRLHDQLYPDSDDEFGYSE